MKLSIITINLNDETGLRKTIDSVINQTFTDYEFIIIDGLSKDGSVDIIKQHQEKIVYWISEKDSGIYNAMNKGIRVAKGEYLYFLNSGDIMPSSDVLDKVFFGDPHESFICGNFFMEEAGKLEENKSYKNRDWTFSLYDLFSGFLCHQAFFIHQSNFKLYGLYDESLRIVSDWKLFFEAIGINHTTVLFRDVDVVIYNMEGLSSQIGGDVIYNEKKKVAQELLSETVVQKLERLYYLEQNCFITDIIKSKSWIYNGFRIFCKAGRTLGFIKS